LNCAQDVSWVSDQTDNQNLASKSLQEPAREHGQFTRGNKDTAISSLAAMMKVSKNFCPMTCKLTGFVISS